MAETVAHSLVRERVIGLFAELLSRPPAEIEETDTLREYLGLTEETIKRLASSYTDISHSLWPTPPSKR